MDKTELMDWLIKRTTHLIKKTTKIIKNAKNIIPMEHKIRQTADEENRQDKINEQDN